MKSIGDAGQIRPSRPAPSYSRKELIIRAEKLSRSFAEEYISQHKKDGARLCYYCPNFEFIYLNCVYPEYSIEFRTNQNLYENDGKPILGRTISDGNRIIVDISRELNPQHPQWIFTCFHEMMGHGILQGEWLKEESSHRRVSLLTTEDGLDFSTTNKLEWQANFFGAQVAAPYWLLNIVMDQVFGKKSIRYIMPAHYTLCSQRTIARRFCGSYSELCRFVAALIQYRFGGLSVEALGYRLAQANCVINQSDQDAERYTVQRSSENVRYRNMPGPARRTQGLVQEFLRTRSSSMPSPIAG